MSVADRFPEVANDAEALERLKALARGYADDVDDLKARWESYAFRHGDPKLTELGTLDAFQSYLIGVNRINQVKRPKIATPKGLRGGIIPKMEFDGLSSRQFKTSRILGFNDQHSKSLDTEESAVPTLQNNTNLAEFVSSRPFNETLRGASSALDQQIENFINLFIDHFGWGRNEIVNPHSISQVDSKVVGRICRAEMQSKSLEDAQRDWSLPLTAENMVIESSKRIGGGSRTPLNFSLLEPKDIDRLFEGAIVAMKGKNPKGDLFIVSKIIELPPLGIPIRECTASAPLRVLLVSSFSSLDTVLGWIRSSKAQGMLANEPSAVLVMGPLGDEVTKVTDILNRFESAGILVVVCPSTEDTIADSVAVFPQPPLQLPAKNTVVHMSNPCTFSLNEVAFTLSTAPTLAHMSLKSDELKFEQILSQRQIYPVFPTHADFNFSQDKYKLTSLIDSWPNVLVLPNSNPCCSLVNNVLCVGVAEVPTMITVVPGKEPLKERLSVQVLEIKETS